MLSPNLFLSYARVVLPMLNPTLSLWPPEPLFRVVHVLFILMLGNLGLPFLGMLLRRFNKALKSQLVSWNFFLPAIIGNANEGLNYKQERFGSEAWVFRTIPRVIKWKGENSTEDLPSDFPIVIQDCSLSDVSEVRDPGLGGVIVCTSGLQA